MYHKTFNILKAFNYEQNTCLSKNLLENTTKKFIFKMSKTKLFSF